MFGYVIGTLCLVGLLWTLRGGRGRRRWGGCGGGPGRCGHGGPPGWGGGRRGEGPPWAGGYRDAPPWARDEGDGGGAWRGSGPGRGRGAGWGRHGFEAAIFRRLDATPEQERALGEAFGAVRSAVRAAREGAGRARGDLATALRQEQVDASTLGELIARFDASTAAVREAVTSALFKAHEVLDARQRRELAELLEGGFFRRGGPWGSPRGPEAGGAS
jgi:Spy/CpxP family protein refolding chaperone